MEEQVEIENHTPYEITRATEGSVGFDLFATRSCVISPDEQEKFNLGIVLHFKDNNIYAEIKSRSGLSCLHGIEIVGSGIIDSDYKKELICYLRNTSQREYTIYAGHRICQLIFKRKVPVTLKTIENKKENTTNQRSGGFGSTGK